MFLRSLLISTLTDAQPNCQPGGSIPVNFDFDINRIMKFGQTGIGKSRNKLILCAGDRERTVEGVLMVLLEGENRSDERFIHGS